MCGFAGEVRHDGPVDADALRRMSAALTPRGPDGSGEWFQDGSGLVHRRLKIIDLSERGAQPMHADDGRLVIAFNGCIYNHHELRAELRAHWDFQSMSDTEVILAAYRHWGPERFVDHLIGMFAFAIFDRGAGGTLTLVRDRLGIKPLYLTDVGDGLRFASTLPALLAGGDVDTNIDPVALHHYLSFHSVVPPPHTMLRGVRKLAPATMFTVEPSGRRRERRYWTPAYERDPSRARWSSGDWRNAVTEALEVAVARRMVADVPVGVLLSGGLDSSLIVALLASQGQSDLATYSIGFSDVGAKAGNEFRYSDLIADRFATRHHRIEIGDAELVGALEGAIDAMSEPMVSHDVVAFHLLSREVSRDLKVVQSGQGADEVFAGYSWYPPLLHADGLGDDVYAGEFIDASHEAIEHELAARFTTLSDVSRSFVADHFARPHAATPLDRALRLDTEVMLVDDPVKRVDNMTMGFGLEARTPFLDHELVELAAACPPEHKLADGGKGVLKSAARALLPAEVIDRPKGYFPVPLLSQLSGAAFDLTRDALRSPRARERGVFREDYVERLLAAPNAHRTTLDGNRLWQLGLLELWLAHHLP